MSGTGHAPVLARRARARIALGAAGLALVTLAGFAWVFRLPLADTAIRGTLRSAGIDADFELEAVDFGGARLRQLRLGPEAAPDAIAASAAASLGWGLTGPRLTGVRLEAPALRVRMDDGISLGQLDRLLRARGTGKGPATLPDLRIEVEEGRALLLTPAGAVPATFSSRGRLTRDFAAEAQIAPVSRAAGPDEIANLRTAIRATTENGLLRLTLDAAADRLTGGGLAIDGLRLTGAAALPKDLSGANGGLSGSAGKAILGDLRAVGVKLEANLLPAADRQWRFKTVATTAALDAPAGGVRAVTAEITGAGDPGQGAGEWSFRANGARLSTLAAPEAAASGAFSYDGRGAGGIAVASSGRLALPAAGLTREGRAQVLAAIPAMGGSPVAPLLGDGKAALDRALSRFSAAATFQLDWRNGAGRLGLPGPFTVDAASGGRVSVTPLEAGKPALMVLLPSGGLEGSARLAMEGGGLPPATLELSRFALVADRLAAAGAAAIADWRSANGRLDLSRTTFSLTSDKAGGRLTLDGGLSVDGRTEALSVSNFRAPVRLDASWGGGFRVALPDRCIPATLDSLGFAGHRFGARAISICADADTTLVAADSAGALSGGFATQRVALSGHTDDASRRPVSLSVEHIVGRFTGAGSDAHLALEAAAPRYAIDFAPDRRIRFDGARVTARTAPGGRVVGVFEGGVLDDPALPAHVREMRARWSADPEGGRTVIRIADGRAHVTDKPPPPAEGSASGEAEASGVVRFNPLLVSGISGALADGRIEAGGDIFLEDGVRRLAGFTARHDLATGKGDARVLNEGLVFDRNLELEDVTKLAATAVISVNGPVGVDLAVTWDGAGMLSRGVIAPRDVSLFATALGPVEGITGAIAFDDLFALTTPPGQNLTIRRLDPGIAVNNGEITLQVLGPERVRIERAAWPFAGGRLSIDPQTVVIGDDTFEMSLTLRDVDVQALIEELNLKDLTATGRVQGDFLLVFDPTGGHIEKGELRAAPGGGTISYTGSAGAGLLGAPQIAFDALKSFAYTDLVIGLKGDLDDEIVSDIRFVGENMQPIGGVLAPGALPVPGIERVKVTGWPFRFAVAVRAPFRKLARTSDGINDARPLVDEAIRQEGAANAPQTRPGVDPPPAPPR